MGAFEELPEECFVAILSRMTPDDVGRLSVVSKAFRSVADSDTVWNHFLDPKFIDFIIPHSHPSIANAPTKKALYLALSDRPIMIDNIDTRIQLHRKSGKKSFMFAIALPIASDSRIASPSVRRDGWLEIET
ncbi:putative F-box domain-containing protein [Medicago truncatula]|uniref:Putative F-box domain-containing protein n=1 Tax=Medicago truncatula TaxID=3880 RepID=A0A396JBI8_MEDTR|nr:putative F-box domain-containing protein [Medicago truncatula]